MGTTSSGRGALTFFRLTRGDNGIALNIVWASNTSGQNIVARWRCSRSLNSTVTFFQSVALNNSSIDGAAVAFDNDLRLPPSGVGGGRSQWHQRYQ